MKNTIEKTQPGMEKSGYLIAAGLMFIDSLHFVFARMLFPHISPNTSAMYVLVIATIEVGIYGLVTRQLKLSTFKKYWVFFLVVGFLIAISTNLTYHSVEFLDAGTASMVSQVSILMGLGFGVLWLKEKLKFPQLMGALIAIIGVVVMNYQAGDYFQYGTLLIIISSFMYTSHTAVTKKYGDQIPFIEFFFFRLLTTSLFLFLFSFQQADLVLPRGNVWLLLLITGTVDITLSRGLYYLTLRRLNVSLLHVLLTLGPLMTIFWSFILIGEVPGPRQLLGGAVVLGGVLIVTLFQQHQGNRKQKTPDS